MLRFKKSSYSAVGNCVEVAITLIDRTVVVRDSKDPNGPRLTYTAEEWEAFIAGVKNGEFDV